LWPVSPPTIGPDVEADQHDDHDFGQAAEDGRVDARGPAQPTGPGDAATASTMPSGRPITLALMVRINVFGSPV
jgi:hypothetical protein